MKKYLVTGGGGFLGSNLTRALVSRGDFVRCLDNEWRGSCTRIKDLAVDVIFGDVRDFDSVDEAVKGIDSVIHLAYINGTDHFYKQPELVLDVAVKGITNIIDACVQHRVSELIVASSSEAYQTPSIIPTPESVPLSIPDPLNPRFSYGGGKIITELMTLNYGRAHFKRAIVLRPHNLYGPDMGTEHVIPQLALRMQKLLVDREVLQNESSPIRLPIQGTGLETRSFIYISDAVDAILRIIDCGDHLNIYNIGSEEEVAIEFLAKEIGRFYGQTIDILPLKLQSGSCLRRCPNISKLVGLGYKQRVSLKEGLEKTLNWYKKQ